MIKKNNKTSHFESTQSLNLVHCSRCLNILTFAFDMKYMYMPINFIT